MEKLARFKPTLKQRGYAYRVAFAVGLVLVAKGVITQEDFDVYELVAVALLGLASANSSVKDE